MTERPILFSGPMVRALLDGQKTQTRRIIKPQPPMPEAFPGSDFGLCRSVALDVGLHSLSDLDRLPKHPTDWSLAGSVGVARDAGFPLGYRCPYGGPGDRLWVKETWGLNDCDYGGDKPIPKQRPADLPDDGLVYFATEDDPEIRNELRWRPSIHMPRWASRLTLDITDVRVERLQDISEADAIAEGLTWRPALEAWAAIDTPSWPTFRDPRRSFAGLWNHINGKGSWTSNSWVWVVSFEVGQ